MSEANGSATGLTVKEMLGNLTDDTTEIRAGLTKLDLALAVHIAEARGERNGGDRTWKIIASLAGLPGVGALVALLMGQATPK